VYADEALKVDRKLVARKTRVGFVHAGVELGDGDWRAEGLLRIAFDQGVRRRVTPAVTRRPVGEAQKIGARRDEPDGACRDENDATLHLGAAMRSRSGRTASKSAGWGRSAAIEAESRAELEVGSSRSGTELPSCGRSDSSHRRSIVGSSGALHALS